MNQEFKQLLDEIRDHLLTAMTRVEVCATMQDLKKVGEQVTAIGLMIADEIPPEHNLPALVKCLLEGKRNDHNPSQPS